MSDRIVRSATMMLAAALAVACGGNRSEPVRVRAGDVEIAASVAPPELRVGDNEMFVELRDASGAPLDGAEVGVDVKMGAMGAMPAMGGPAHVEALGDGRYRAHFKLDMGGTWQVAVRAKPATGALATAEGSLTIGTPGLRLEATSGAPAISKEAAATHQHLTTSPGEFRFDPARLRQVGVRSEPARRAELDATVRAVGRVVWDESALRDVTMRVGGFAGDVEADALGAPVKQGQTLFLFYSPEIFAAQREYLDALRAKSAARATSAPERATGLASAAERRLRLWGVDAGEIAAIARRGSPQEFLPVRAPISGYVVEKEIVAGSAVASGVRVYRIAPLDHVWIEAEVYESELAQVKVGMPAEVTLPQLPEQRFAATVAYVYPSLQSDRRTARVRLVLANPDGVLRPDMYATVTLRESRGARLTVPESAVLRAGDRSFVFLDLGDGRLRPQRVETGIESDGRVEITSGIEEGQPVVVAGTFLVAGESRLRAALESW
jgi:Cu(I)/Ag(I) efflux system membrane fusion protein